MRTKLKREDAPVTHAETEPAVCEDCGNDFTCGAALNGCWCEEIELSERVRGELREMFRDCLCRSCLEQHAADQL